MLRTLGARTYMAAASMVVALLSSTAAFAQSPEEWVARANQVHGHFDAFTALGIRIGLDALRDLRAHPHEVAVIYFGSESTPRARIADGIALAISAPNSAHSVARDMPAGVLAVIEIRKEFEGIGGQLMRYTLREGLLPQLEQWNRELSPVVCYKTMMIAQGLFSAEGRHYDLLRPR